MTPKELKKLKRTELLEILLARTAEVERLKKELDEANKKLEDRAILLENAGSIAEASLKLNGVFEAAEAAAEQYLKNIERVARGESEIAPDEKPAEDEAVPEEKPAPAPKKAEKPKKSKQTKKAEESDQPKEDERSEETEKSEKQPEGAE